MSNRTIHTLGTSLAATLTAAALAFAPVTAWAGDLAQVVSADEEVATPGTEATIDHGHVDLGLLLVDGQAQFLARDDSAATPVWRDPADVVFDVGDNAQLTLPEDKAFSFVGAEPGSQVWVVPQTEQADVPWLGWNTQAPSLTDNVDRGLTMEFLGHQGPGEFSLFLQNGGFEEPQLLWSTATGATDGFWVDLGTHTHANWVFSEPGIHQVRVRMSGQGAGESAGSDVAAEATLTFAVGAGTDVAQAHAAQWDPSAVSSDASAGAAVPVWVWALAGAGLLVLVGAVFAVLRAKGGRRG
ncbi:MULTISPECIES: choice-of-anchor M domain-containing protein [unclassified Corynebacterium]|uniref:Peptidase n=1 Tax=Corynebacterium minutissimum TaxID=38301 RepID=A0ACC4UBQ7_9CORY|nr:MULTISPECIES: choice-of-anchor M domain-containing protein [unclassified Corynebacterium]KKO80365.1 peptidase [Corynebacterium minutissimum]OFN75210.1 peptidase [Corynebacterium sp. HMSC070E08]OFP30344.1 peptidase [Corynebacterium sp. HMSC068G04]OHO54337.1 peptidase [Corynebacterium sp. HMSC035E02]